jgi:hypothetical protein
MPVLHHRRGRAVVEAAADGRIAAADDLEIAVERAAGVDLAARVDGGRDFERRLEHVDGGGRREELHVRRRSERLMRRALGHDASRVDFHDLDARIGGTRRGAVDERGKPLLERHAHSRGRDGARRGLARRRRLAARRGFLLLLRLCFGRGVEQRDEQNGADRHQARGTKGHQCEEYLSAAPPVQTWCYRQTASRVAAERRENVAQWRKPWGKKRPIISAADHWTAFSAQG